MVRATLARRGGRHGTFGNDRQTSWSRTTRRSDLGGRSGAYTRDAEPADERRHGHAGRDAAAHGGGGRRAERGAGEQEGVAAVDAPVRRSWPDATPGSPHALPPRGCGACAPG